MYNMDVFIYFKNVFVWNMKIALQVQDIFFSFLGGPICSLHEQIVFDTNLQILLTEERSEETFYVNLESIPVDKAANINYIALGAGYRFRYSGGHYR